MDQHDPMHYDGLEGEHSYELRVGSLISPDRIRDRHYQTVKAEKLPNLFADYQRRDGLLIPIWSVRDKIESFQLKPNTPRIGKNGKPIKYETAIAATSITIGHMHHAGTEPLDSAIERTSEQLRLRQCASRGDSSPAALNDDSERCPSRKPGNVAVWQTSPRTKAASHMGLAVFLIR